MNINLKNKPEWFWDRNPLGMVPILEYNDKIVYESTVCDDYLEDIYPETRLMPVDPYEKAKLKILMEIFTKVGTHLTLKGTVTCVTSKGNHIIQMEV